jgi:putative ABC transport system permease protein
MAVGVLILLVACFNFTNLATARAMIRAREISLRKVVGAARRQIVIQFLNESVLTAMIALVLALALTEMLLPSFDHFLNAPVQFHYLRDWPVLLLVIGIGVGVGLVSGVYPALVLSGIRPGDVLRSNAGLSGSSFLRIALVVFQFAVSIGLGIAVLVVFEQVSLGRHIDLGFRKDGIIVIQGDNLLTGARQSFVQALRGNPDVLGVTTSDEAGLPFVLHENHVDVHWPGGPANDLFRNIDIGSDFLSVYDMRLLAGRALSENYGRDIAGEPLSGTPFNALINETAAHRMGYTPRSAIGKTITAYGSPATIVGVVADTKIHGLSELIPPTMYWDHPAWADQISVRVAGQRLPETLAFIDKTWHRFAPNSAMERHFLDDDFEKQFLADERQGDIFGLFVAVTIFIACLGLFGLAAFSTQRRTKEIGLRKTFGARTRDIILLLLWQFSIPVLVANLIAWPVAYYYLSYWLEGYAYRISLSPLYFLAAGAAALVIAWATVIVHAANVARANPIHALRYE